MVILSFLFIARRIIQTYQPGTPISINIILTYLAGIINDMAINRSIVIEPSIMIESFLNVENILKMITVHYLTIPGKLSFAISSSALSALDTIGKGILRMFLQFLPSNGSNENSSLKRMTETDMSLYQDYIVIIRTFLRHLAYLDIRSRNDKQTIDNLPDSSSLPSSSISLLPSSPQPSCTAILYTRIVQSMLAVLLPSLDQFYQSFVIRKHSIGNLNTDPILHPPTKKKRNGGRGVKFSSTTDDMITTDHSNDEHIPPCLFAIQNSRSIPPIIEQGFLYDTTIHTPTKKVSTISSPSSSASSSSSLPRTFNLPHHLLSSESLILTNELSQTTIEMGEKIIHSLFFIGLLLSDLSMIVSDYDTKLETVIDNTYILRTTLTTDTSGSNQVSFTTVLDYLGTVHIATDTLTDEQFELHFRIVEGVQSIRTLLKSSVTK